MNTTSRIKNSISNPLSWWMKVYIALSTHMFSSFLPTSLEIQLNIGEVIEVSGASQVAQWQRICLQCRRCQRRGFNPWVGKIPWRGGNGNPLQYSCLGNPMDRGAGRPQSMGLQRARHDWATKPARLRYPWTCLVPPAATVTFTCGKHHSLKVSGMLAPTKKKYFFP